ncbi:MAG TPA: hypothetical protein VIN56_09885 [Candidatus Dormibacteraeota bacterium]|jgi:hypothetical protein
MAIAPEHDLLGRFYGAFQKLDPATMNACYAPEVRFRGRDVENHVRSHFWFKDGLITRQEDSFDLWKWASMALGPMGQFLGWLPPVQASIRKQAKGNLDKFTAASGDNSVAS